MYRWLLFLGIALCCTASGCNKDKRTQAEIDRDIILEYLEFKGLEAEEHSSGLFYIITQEGNGIHPSHDASITIRYKGYLTSGNVFDQTPGTQTRTFDLQNLIQGWQIGIPLLTKGGKGTLLIPSGLGYGNQIIENIPRNSVLIFEVHLVDFSH